MRSFRSWPLRSTLTAINVALALMLSAIGAVVVNGVMTARENDFERASIEGGNMATVLSQEISRNLELYDLSIRGALESVVKPEVMSAPKDLRQLILFDRAATATYLGHILVLNAAGSVIADSASTTLSAINYADRDYFKVQAEQPNYGLYVSRPLISRADGYRMIALSRRFNNSDGSFGGVIVGTIKLEYFHHLFRQIKLQPGASLTLFRKDGTLVMREPYDPATIGTVFKKLPLLELAKHADQGQYEATSVVDGIERLFRFHRVGDSPLVQNVGLSVVEIYAQWRRRTAINVVILLICCLTIILLTLFLSRELKRRAEAEIALQELSDRDALTGLANRRCFDRTLLVEWSRAARDGKPLALLMIDADQFKLFNDTLGHQAGDAALTSMAACLQNAARRPSDLAARYGGEEFAILLPSTDPAGAETVAEAVRTAVRNLGIEHPRAETGVFTVSIGIAALVPLPGQTASSLIGAADEALYASKEAGRDQSTCYRQTAADLAA